MGRAPCCDKANVKRGPWSPEEDSALKNYVEKHGTGGNWIALPQKAGLKRCGKSCRLRWLNYLRPDIKHGGFTEEEDDIICSLYKSIGSRWSVIASKMKGRTDNDVKNYWNTKLKKKFMAEQTSYPNNNKNKNNRNYTTSLVTTPKVDNFGYSNYLNLNSISTLSLPLHTSFQEDYNTQQRFVSDTTSEYQFPLLSRIMEDNSELISSTNSLVSSRTTTISSSQEVVSVLDPIQSSSLYIPNFENNYSNYESFDQDGLLMDYGLSYGDDLLQDFGFYHQEKTNSEASAVTAASSSAANNIYDYFRACKTSSITNY